MHNVFTIVVDNSKYLLKEVNFSIKVLDGSNYSNNILINPVTINKVY